MLFFFFARMWQTLAKEVEIVAVIQLELKRTVGFCVQGK